MSVIKIFVSLALSITLLASAQAAGTADAPGTPTFGPYLYFAALDQRCSEKDASRATALAEYKSRFVADTRALADTVPATREFLLKQADRLEKNGPLPAQLAAFKSTLDAKSPEQIAVLCKAAAQDIRDHMREVQAMAAPEAGKAGRLRLAMPASSNTIVSYFGNPHDDENSPDQVPPISTNEEVVYISAHPPVPALLQVTIMKPAGPGPFPLVIFNHGSTGNVAPSLQTRYRHSSGVYYFLARGYAVAAPMMRGYAGSTGHQAPSVCNQEIMGLGNAFDIDTVIDYMSRQPYIDPKQVLVAGTSFGGWNTLAYGVLNGNKVKGLINFSGGVLIGSCTNAVDSMEEAAEHYGRVSRTPSIWFYGENDSLFGNELWHTMHARYVAAGGKAELVDIGKFLEDSHSFLSYPEAMPLWASRLDIFLRSIGSPDQVRFPAYIASPFPPPSHYASLEDTQALPYANDGMRKVYQSFLSAPAPRAFFVAPTGWSWASSGGFDVLARGKRICAEQHQQCQVYAVDDTVTWVKPPPGPPASSDADLRNLDAVPYMTESGKQAYRQFLSLRGLRAFAVAKDGGYGFAAGGNAAADAMASCGKEHLDCKLYVVDQSIVWK